MERPRIFLETKTTTSALYVDLLAVQISNDAKGLSYLKMVIAPHASALYEITITTLLDKDDLALPTTFIIELPHLTSGVYKGLNAGDTIQVRHRSPDGVTVVTSGILLQINEVVED